MKQKSKTISLLSTMLILSTHMGANSTQKQSMEQIYNTMCIECHSTDGSGNTEKLTPSMQDLSQSEIYDSLVEIEEEDGHIIMQHNRDQIVKKGMNYSAKEMAEYLNRRFSE